MRLALDAEFFELLNRCCAIERIRSTGDDGNV
jgi:hypothetical protein